MELNRLRPYAVPLALALIGVVAVVFRLSDLGGRDLWTDEAWVALAALKPTPAEALAAGRSTPPFYILTVWAAAHLWGGSELVLRSLSCLFSLGALAAFWFLARNLAPLSVSLVSLTALAWSPVMVYYAKELKQYSGDAFFAVLILLLVERLRKRPAPANWLVLLLVGVVGLGYSHALLFTLPVAGVVLWFSLPGSQRPRAAFLGLGWGLAFAAYYLAFFRYQYDPDLVSYWTQDFPDFSGLWALCHWWGAALHRYFWYFLGEWGPFWGPPLVLAGLIVLWRRDHRRVALYLGGPLLVAFAAACLHRYPFMAHYGGNRLMLFSAPMLYLVVACGGCAVFAWLWRPRRQWLALALAGMLLVGFDLPDNLRENLHPLNNREELRPLVAHLENQLQPRDLVYVYYFAVSPFQYYYRGPLPRLCWGQSCVEGGLDEAAADDPAAPRRIWLIASHIPDVPHMRKFAAGLLGPGWQETACFTREGCVLFRFDR